MRFSTPLGLLLAGILSKIDEIFITTSSREEGRKEGSGKCDYTFYLTGETFPSNCRTRLMEFVGKVCVYIACLGSI